MPIPSFANLFAPSTETMRGVSARTGFNLPDLPYSGIMSLLTGGPVGLAAQYAANNLIPKLINSVDPEVGNVVNTQDNAATTYALDKILGKLPEGKVNWDDYIGFEPIDEPVTPELDFESALAAYRNILDDGSAIPAMDAGGFDFDTLDYGMPSMDFQAEAPTFDYSAFEYRNGGKV